MFLELLTIFFASLPPLLWLQGSEVVIGNDSGARIDGMQHLINLFFSWNPTLSFGYDWSVMKGHMIVKFPEMIFQLLTGSQHIGQMLMFVFWFFIMGSSMYMATRLLYPAAKFWFLRLWTALFWMYNFFILYGWVNIDRAKFSLFAALPLLFAISVRVAQEGISPVRAAALASLVLFFLNGGGSAPLYGGLLITLGTTFVVLLYTTKSLIARRHLWQFLGLGGIAAFLTNAWWIWPLAYTTLTSYKDALAAQGGTAGILGWEAMVSTNTSYFNLLRLQGIPGWQEGAIVYAHAFLTNPLLVLISFVPIGCVGLLLIRWRYIPQEYKKRSVLVPLVIVIPLGLLFAAGTHPPLGFIYRAFIEHIPGFAIFRSSFFKFAPALWFPIIFLSGVSLQLLLQSIRHTKLRRALTVLLLSGIIGYHYPFFLPNFFAFSPPFTTKVTIPTYVPQTLTDMKALDPSSRILLVPPLDSRYLSNSYTWGFWSVAMLPNFGAPRSIVTNEKNTPSIVSDLYRALENGDAPKATAIAHVTGITHALWQADILYSDMRTSADLSAYHQTLLQTPGIEKVASHGAWQLYKLDNIAPKLMDVYSAAVSFSSADDSVADLASLFAQTHTVSITQKTSLPQTHTILEATCSGCDRYANDAYKHLALPSLRLFPDSPFYLISTIKENRTAVKLRQHRAAMVDLHTGFLGKRLAELAYLTHDADKNAATIEDTATRLKDHLSAIANLVTELPPETQLVYANRIEEFLSFYESKLIELPLPQDLLLLLQNKFTSTKQVLQQFRFVSRDETLRYFVTIPESGSYQIRINPMPSHARLLVEGNERANGTTLTLASGLQKIELIQPKNVSDIELPPRVYLQKNTTLSTTTPPRITYERVSPTYIRGTVAASTAPYLVTFGDTFHEGWRLTTTPRSSGDHIKINGYANGWVLPAGPARSFTISYWPQTLTVMGSATSVLAVIILVWYLWSSGKRDLSHKH